MVVKLKRRSGAKKKQASPQTAPARLLSRGPVRTAPALTAGSGHGPA
jgi:hypothetical protein